MKFERQFTNKGNDAYAGMDFKKFKEDLADCLVSKLSKMNSGMACE